MFRDLGFKEDRVHLSIGSACGWHGDWVPVRGLADCALQQSMDIPCHDRFSQCDIDLLGWCVSSVNYIWCLTLTGSFDSGENMVAVKES